MALIHRGRIRKTLVCTCVAAGLAVILSSFRANVALASTPANFAILVDTSGSMVGYYQRRDPRPCLVLELVESLITETLVKGDRLTLLTFDHEIHDAPGDIIALNPLDPATALRELEKLQLRTRPGFGTIRTAGLGRGVKALQALAGQSGGFSGGVIYVVTDRDEDQVPEGRAKEFYDFARTRQKTRDLICLSRIPQGDMILEVWQMKGHPGAPAPPSSATAIEKVKRLLKQIIPQRPVTSGPVAADFENGHLLLKTNNASWKRSPSHEAQFELPVTLVSKYRTLHFRGSIDPQAHVVIVGAKAASTGRVQLRFPAEAVKLAPGSTVDGVLRLSGLPKPGILQFTPTVVNVDYSPMAKGAATTDPSLFQTPDPASAARVSGVLWVDPCQPKVIAESGQLPKVVLYPPRALQVILLIVVLLLACGLVKLLLPSPVPPLTVHYWVEGAGAPAIASLNTADATFPLIGVNASLQRQATSSEIVVRPGPNAELFTAAEEKKSDLSFTQGGRFLIKGADGRLTGVNFDFGKNPPRPEPEVEENPDSAQPSTGSLPSGAGRSEDDWGLGDTSS